MKNNYFFKTNEKTLLKCITESQLLDTYVKSKVSYWECNKRYDTREKKKGKTKNNVIGGSKTGGSYEGMTRDDEIE